jgi:hypothetical protein
MADVSVTKEPLPNKPEPMLNYCLRGLGEDEKSHDILCHKIESNYRAWRGILERRSEAAGWTNKQHPALAYQAIDTLLAGLLDPNPTWRLKARPRMVGPGDVPNVEELKAGIRANELLLNDELLVDGYAEKQVVFLLQNFICGLTVQKNYWRNSVGPAITSKITSEPIYAPNSGKILSFVPKVTSKNEGQEVYFDGPTSMPIDVRDFIWHQAATSLDTASRVAHRVWYDIGQLKELEAKGIYKNIDKLIEEPGATESLTNPLKTREQDLFQTDRTKDKVEVLECWIDHGRRVVSIANRKVVIRDTGNPFRFEHLSNQYPFVVCSTTPDMFRIAGVSEVELIRETQEILWTLLNQRLDNLQLVNNAIVLLRDDIDDPDSFDFYPGARNLVYDPSQVQMWTPNIQIADLSLNAEGIARNDLQNLIGASQAAQGLVDTETATQANIVATLAQKRLAMKKQMTKYAGKRTGEQWMAMNQQMISHDKFVPIVGKDGELAMEKIEPLMLQGRYQIDVDQMDESELRQERRGEAQALLQVAGQLAPVFAATGKPLNMQAFMDNLLDSYDVQDKDAYYSANPQQPPATSPQGAQGPEQGPGGVTAPQASDPFQQSGTQAVAQMLAQRGGAANVGQEMPLNGR